MIRRLPPISLLLIIVGALAAGPAAPRSQLLTILRADAWHRAGFRGHGVKVAVLDTGFRGYADSQGSTLPRGIHAKSFRFDGNMEARKSQHGVLCGEIVHAIAPDAELLFVNWQPDVPESFVAAINWAKQQGARIVTCSVVMPAWSDGEGGGRIHRAINELVDDDMLCVACAGNLAKRHWSGRFRPDADGWHRWPDGSIDNEVTPWGDDVVSLELSATNGSFEVLTFDEGGKPVGRSGMKDSDCGTAVRFTPRFKAKYSVRVRSTTGGSFHLCALGSWLGQYRERGSITFPGDGAAWLTLGAWEKGHRADYSSCGPNSLTQKPDLVAPVPFVSRERQQPFGGTSAAAPQAAGLAAVYWSRHPNATASEVKAALRQAAEDVGDPGIDYESGWGLLRLPSLR
jgi:subtilisin family serine protease